MAWPLGSRQASLRPLLSSVHASTAINSSTGPVPHAKECGHEDSQARRGGRRTAPAGVEGCCCIAVQPGVQMALIRRDGHHITLRRTGEGWCRQRRQAKHAAGPGPDHATAVCMVLVHWSAQQPAQKGCQCAPAAPKSPARCRRRRPAARRQTLQCARRCCNRRAGSCGSMTGAVKCAGRQMRRGRACGAISNCTNTQTGTAAVANQDPSDADASKAAARLVSASSSQPA